MIMNHFSPRTVLKLIRFWPPYFGANIAVQSINDEFTQVVVRMKQRFYNTNYVGTHFGGSLYSMCDPFYMFILLHHLKKEHIVWDQAADIRFVKPGKGTVTVKFEISLEEIEKIKEQAKQEYSIRPVFHAEILNQEGVPVAELKKTLYVRRKDAKKPRKLT